jgi:hypothetical protein
MRAGLMSEDDSWSKARGSTSFIRARNSCLETAGGGVVCTFPWTMLAHEGASLGRGRLPGREGVRVAPILRDRPATPVEGEAGGRGCAPAPLLAFRCLPLERGRRGGGDGSALWWWRRPSLLVGDDPAVSSSTPGGGGGGIYTYRNHAPLYIQRRHRTRQTEGNMGELDCLANYFLLTVKWKYAEQISLKHSSCHCRQIKIGVVTRIFYYFLIC